MWIVKLALNRPYTFIVVALLILLLGILAIRRTPTDIFPVIDIPVITVIWTYNGLSPEEMEKRITTYSEYALSGVNDVRDIESQTVKGISVIKIYFQPTVHIDAAEAQINNNSQTILRTMPPGTQPPLIVRYNASSVPILQLSLSSKTLSESQLRDYGTYRIRRQLASTQGTIIPPPTGGKRRQIMVDLNIKALTAKGLTPTDVSNAINAQNLLLPTGTAKIGAREYTVSLNSSPEAIDALNHLPVGEVNGSMVYIRDVAHVRDGFAVQENIIRQDGRRTALITILKSGSASTLEVVNNIKKTLAGMQATAPPGLEINALFDQSIFVRAAVEGVVTESIIAACLTSTMILLFLGSWRSTLIVTISIPLSILCSVIVLGAFGFTLNVMTLGGIALAIGILVDDATVEIENIHRNLDEGKILQQAILDGAQQIAVPTFVATLTICIVFVSVLFLTGPAQYLFTPMALAVVCAVFASYLLSRTLVPVLVKYLLAKKVVAHGSSQNELLVSPGFFMRIHRGFNEQFEALRERYTRALAWALGNRGKVLLMFGCLFTASSSLLPFIGEDFFPSVDAGQFRLHVRVPAGTRIEETERIFTRVEAEIRKIIPPEELALILDNIGLPDGINMAFTDNATISAADGEILVSLQPDNHGPTPLYMQQVRQRLRQRFPQLIFFFQPADIVSQILNFGLPAPIDIQISGFDRENNYRIAQEIAARVTAIPGAVDVHVHQVLDAPEIRLNVDRTRTAQLGLTQREVAANMLVSLSSSGQVSPNFWIDPQTGVSYLVAIQTPQHQINSIDAIHQTPVVAASGLNAPLQLNNFTTVERRKAAVVANHFNVQPVFDVYANVQNRDLGGVSADIEQVVAEYTPRLAPGNRIVIRGQVESMKTAFSNLGMGLVFAAVVVYLLMVVNFQSWIHPLVIITALPGALCGIIWMLFVTHTTFNVPSLMGAIMSVGVATANSILLVTFANQHRKSNFCNATEAALTAGTTRLRPILMTALAMMIGMLPMSLGMGEGGEQNAPLARAVIGGLLLATSSTLFLVPVVYSFLCRRASTII